MTAPVPTTGRGILYMITAIFLFSCMDVMAKFIGQRTDTVMAIWARYAGQAIIVFLLVLPRIKTVAKTKYPKLQLLRSVLLLMGTASFFFGITLIGIAEATAIFDVNPVLVTFAAALFLGEKIGVRRMAGIGVSLIGAMIVIRPGSDVFSIYALLPLIAAFAYTGYAITTRFVGRDEDVLTSLLYTAAFGAIVLTIVVPFYWVPPDAVTVILMVAIGAFAALGHSFLIRAFVIAEASVLAPFVYVGLIFATFSGIVWFGEYPDLATCVGALVIVAAGIYVWHRETRGALATQ